MMCFGDPCLDVSEDPYRRTSLLDMACHPSHVLIRIHGTIRKLCWPPDEHLTAVDGRPDFVGNLNLLSIFTPRKRSKASQFSKARDGTPGLC